MTARSGDALLHVSFQVSPNADSTQINAPEFFNSGLARQRSRRMRSSKKKSFPSYLHGRHETPLRNETDRPASFAQYLPKSFSIDR
jgi:hypothetical protein